LPLFRKKKKPGYEAKYLYGHSAFPKAMKVRLILTPNHLEIPQMPLHIPYERISNVQSTTSGAVLKKDLMMLTYTDEIGIEQNMVFEVENIEEVQPAIYRRIASKAGGAPSTPVSSSMALPPPPPPPQIETVYCRTCGKPATYIPQYQRYYCYNCKKYLPQTLPPP